jgi:4-amino-4-deoxy-L-arabinose transferase-like glycosyltransferase
MFSLGFSEYIYTGGLLLAFATLLVSISLGRKHISDVFRKAGLRKKHIAYALVAVVIFVAAELYLVHPTQQLFFDDAIYQAMALDLIHTGQAWMCDYGTTTACFIGEIFHEPIGTSFNLALGYLVMGVNLNATYTTMLVLSAIAVFLVFFAAFLLLNDARAAFFSSLILGLTPVVLVWARATSSDIPTLTYSLVALLFMAIFLRKKNIYTFAMFGSSLVLVSYMKVNNLLLIAVFLVMYVLLDEKSILSSIKDNYKLVKRGFSSTKAFAVFVILVLALAPELVYTYQQNANGNYGAQGTTVQNTCGSGQVTASGNFGLSYFQMNICANVFFWFDEYKSTLVTQSVLFTALGIIGAVIMFFEKRRVLLAIGIWFLAFFVLYTAFYAGGATYGVDWRYMISLVAQASLFAGFACSSIITLSRNVYVKIARPRLKKSKLGRNAAMVTGFALVILILYSISLLAPQLSVQPGSIVQAGDARFYENFVYTNISHIPSDCLVFSYDPTLFFINNRSALQMSYIYNSQMLQNLSESYSCLVVDYGYWCYTPNNLCTNLRSVVNLTPIINATYKPEDKVFGFYYATPR